MISLDLNNLVIKRDDGSLAALRCLVAGPVSLETARVLHVVPEVVHVKKALSTRGERKLDYVT